MKDFNPDIVFKDMHFVIVNKPFGMLSQKDKSGELGINELLYEKLGKPNFWEMIQRLDRVAGGLMTIALSKRAGMAMKKIQEERQIKKTYLAICEGVPKDKEGELSGFIRKIQGATRYRILTEKASNSKSVKLTYRVAREENGRALLEIQPTTGRTHQIRTQLASIGCPIVGDKKYGKTNWLEDKSICLFSQKIEFVHPITQKEISIEQPLPSHKEVWSDFK